MEKLRFGRTELMVSKVALGGIPIMRISKTEATRLIHEIIDLGINFFDTANGYADSEEKFGEGIKEMKREDIIIATKSMADDKKTFNEHLDLSLKRLGVDYIDIYQLHNVTSKARWDAVYAPGGAMEGLEEAVKAGKVRFPGISVHNIAMAMEHMKTGRFDVVQLPFNYIDHAAANEAIPLAKKLDMGFLVMKPMGGGTFDNAGLAFRFLMSYNGILPIPGIEKIEEIREIISVVEKNEPLSEEDKKEIEKQRIEFGSSWCHRCDYCLPCPQGVHISMILWIKSFFKRMTVQRARSFTGPSVEKARTCLKCGSCVSRCPYDLDIPSLLKESISFWDSQEKSTT